MESLEMEVEDNWQLAQRIGLRVPELAVEG
jgi:hypothetical protein